MSSYAGWPPRPLAVLPDPLTSVPTCLSAHLDSASACTPDRTSALNAAGITAEQFAGDQAIVCGGPAVLRFSAPSSHRPSTAMTR